MSYSFLKRIKNRALVVGFCTMMQLRRTPPPKTVIWECTLACTMDCVHCGAKNSDPIRDELSTGEIKDIIRDLSRMGVMRFLATGGEPLLRPDLIDVLQTAKEYGLETGLSTNGAGISRENVAGIVRAADSIQISVDGSMEIHDSLRRTDGAFAGAMNALALLKEGGCRQTCMTSIISPLNIHELEELYELARKHADLWRVGTVMPIGRASEDDTLFLSDGQLLSLLDFITRKMCEPFPILIGENLGYLGRYDKMIHRDDFFFCGIGIISCCIGADGRIRGCPELPPSEELRAGDLREESFEKIWERGFLQFRDEGCPHLSDECRECPDLGLCRGGCRVMGLKLMHCTRKRLESPG
jgi:radical SAM protein with 4Fe4S-binding SPASM domain